MVTLIEYDEYLNKVQGTPLIHYTGKHRPKVSHGITSLSYLADGSIVFGTHIGYLYKITPSDTGVARVTKLGWLHPDGEAYNPVLMPLDGTRHVAGITKRRGNGYQLFVYDIEQQTSRPVALEFPNNRKLILYGSNTRDDQGRGYIVGRRDSCCGGSTTRTTGEARNQLHEEKSQYVEAFVYCCVGLVDSATDRLPPWGLWRVFACGSVFFPFGGVVD